MPLLYEQLSDNFDDNSTDSVKWPAAYTSSATYSETGKQLVITLAGSTSGSNYAGYATDPGYDLTANYAQIEVVSVPSQSTSAQVIFKIQYDSNNAIAFIESAGTLAFQTNVAGGGYTSVASVTYNPIAHRFWRIRELSGAVYWDTSPDGINWTSQASTLTPIDITSTFVEFSAGTYQSETNPGSAIFDNFNIEQTQISNIQKTYMYKIYRNGEYLGLLDNVIGDFSYSQDINTAFVQTTIDVALDSDSASQELSPLLDEQSNVLLDEQGEILYEEAAPVVFGDDSDNALIRNGNSIKVYEISDTSPSGVIVFDGYIEKYIIRVGKDNNASIICNSNGSDMSDYIVAVDATTLIVEQTTNNAYVDTSTTGNNYVTQTFTPGSNYNLGQISVYLDWRPSGVFTNSILTLNVYKGTPVKPNLDTPSLASSTISDRIQGNHWAGFTLNQSVAVTSGTQYYFVISVPTNTSYHIRVGGTGLYAGGQLFIATYPTSNYDSYSDYDFAFKLYSSDNNILSTFSIDDPTDIVEIATDNYVSQGGLINYGTSSLDATNLSVSYTFQMATMLEVVEKCLALAPYDWYWYVHPAENILYFKQTSTVANHVFILGRHIEMLELTATSENIKNVVYFSGGDTGYGSNLFSYYVNEDSIENTNRRRLARVTDGRVTNQTTADTMSDNILDEYASDEYQTPVTILSGTYNINSINVGDVVGFTGFGNTIDRLLLRVARITRYPDKVELVLGKLPVRLDNHIYQALSDISELQIADNPDTPT